MLAIEGLAMSRYFFDLVSLQRTELDFRGCDLASRDKALAQAEIVAIDLALDLGIDAVSAWHGWSVEVRDPGGERLFCVPVPDRARLAA